MWDIWIFTLCWKNGFEERRNCLSPLHRDAEMQKCIVIQKKPKICETLSLLEANDDG
jgi:hypothetical protein